MTESGKKYLADIQRAVALIESFVSETASFESYTADEKTKSAVERQLGIIGEAVNKYSKESYRSPLKHAGQITGLRNRIIHAYDNLDDSIIWAVLTRHIQPLKQEVNQLLAD